jgi:hypothetical protein
MTLISERLSGLPEPFHGDKDRDPRNCEMPELKHALSIPLAAMGRSRNKSPWIRLVPVMSAKQNLSAA